MSQTDNSKTSTPEERVHSLFIRHASELRGFILALQPNFSLVDDIFQETFLTVSRKAATYDPQRSFLPWACGIARLKVFEAARKQPKLTQPLSEEVIDALCASVPEDTGLPQDQWQAVMKCMERLAPHTRQIIELRYEKGHKPPEIARQLEWSLPSVYVVLSRARAELRRCVDRLLTTDPAEL